ncbi:OmpH family outer membrane protein [Pelosinus baikalensis]|uniref:OmpH family outer membrane protein n=1 Tax=Pelosinus baikalensis TaxID=2892015 RepID=A0ABS8HYW6_9FIRM|nr:OmpH family outer membrane protein [Pelosinus baikalensis]MCC5467786.1 OmpH family outer membrane protein [Pelosinus baikalensis]
MKIISKQLKNIFLGAFLLLSIVTIAQPSTTYAASKSNVSQVGVVNYQLLVQQHPDAAKSQETMNAAVVQAKSDLDSKSVNMNDQEKQAYYQQLQQGLAIKEKELLGALQNKVDAAIAAIAKAKGLATIVDKGSVVYGGQDITDDVMKKITGK